MLKQDNKYMSLLDTAYKSIHTDFFFSYGDAHMCQKLVKL